MLKIRINALLGALRRLLTCNYDSAGVAPCVFEADFDPGPVRAERESVRPFDDHDGLLSKCIFESERLEIGEVFNAVEVDVMDFARGRVWVFYLNSGGGAV